MGSTVYKLCRTAQDYKLAHRLADPLGGAWMTFPTILALDGGEPVGVISRHRDQKILRVGRWVARTPQIALRLVELFEDVLAQAGVTKYLVAVGLEDERLLSIIERGNRVGFPTEPVAKHDGHMWFERRLNGQDNSRSSAGDPGGTGPSAGAD